MFAKLGAEKGSSVDCHAFEKKNSKYQSMKYFFKICLKLGVHNDRQ